MVGLLFVVTEELTSAGVAVRRSQRLSTDQNCTVDGGSGGNLCSGGSVSVGRNGNGRALVEADKQRAEREEEQRLAAEKAAKANLRTVNVEGKLYDLNKMTVPKLKTLVESLGLEVSHNGEKKDLYADAVKAAILAKYPDAEVTEEAQIEAAQTEAEVEAAQVDQTKGESAEEKSEK